MWMSQHSIFGIEGKIGYFRLIFDQILAKNTTLNSKTNQKACFYVSFHHIWRYILIEDVSAQYARHQSCVFGILGGRLLILAYFRPIFDPSDPHIPQKRSKLILVYQLKSYMTLMSHICTIYSLKSTIIPDLSYFFTKNVDFLKKGPGTDRFFHF